ncbi:MAG: [protein-PII] uridylyltransferase [Opitutales bacterium]|jgi:[protein-PII] uridylyltransferase
MPAAPAPETLASLRQEAEALLRPSEPLSKNERVPLFKEFIQRSDERFFKAHRAGASGLELVRERSLMMDVVIENLFLFATRRYEAEHGPLPVQTCVVALGGYGRAELCPFSDVDIMFLYPRHVKPAILAPAQSILTDEILYPLWDIGLKVGHSTRAINETIEEAKANMQTKNSLLESRLVTGSDNLFQIFEQAYRNYCRSESPREYIQARLRDLAERRAKYGNTVFLQEPEVKNGVGGLRDYHNILWMARIRLDVENLQGLVDRQYLRPAESEALLAAYDFLLRVRNELHFSNGRANDLLDIEKQPQVAWDLGYQQPDIFRRIEAFMRDYYRHAQTIYRYSCVLERRLAIAGEDEAGSPISFKALITARRNLRQKHIEGFVLTGTTLAQENPKLFEEDPTRLLRVFRLAQQLHATLDFELTLLISDSLHLITPELQRDPRAVRSFLAILQEVGQVYPILAEMHELGVLGKFVPEFNGLTCLVQHEYYHRYTADIHTLNTIKELDMVFGGEGEFAARYNEEIRETSDPWLLYVILLLHDIGKSLGIKDHPRIGAELAEPVLMRWGIDLKNRETILFIIRQHLEMARFWQRFDVDDPDTAAKFAQLVGDPENLRFLYVHTYCDARGTAISLWNSYKNILHARLFANTLDVLEGQEATRQKYRERKQMMLKDILAINHEGIAPEEIEAHFNLLPERYFIHCSPQEVYLHLRMVNQLLSNISQADSLGSLVPVIDWQDDPDQSLTIVNVVTWDRAGLFYKLAGAFTVAGVNILSTKAISRTDHIAIDTFYVCDPGGGPVQNKQSREIFARAVQDALLHHKDFLPEILEQARKHARLPYLREHDRLRAPIPPSIEVYHELTLRRTIIEVQANDQIGLLYQLAKAISDHGFDITFARISTERGVALDTFYIESLNPNDPNPAAQLASLREALNQIVSLDKLQAVG